MVCLFAQELSECEDASRLNAQRMDLLAIDESTDLYAQAFGSFVLQPPPSEPATAGDARDAVDCQRRSEVMQHMSRRIDQLQSLVDALNTQVATRTADVERLNQEVIQSQVS